jgi:serine/threonine-protein kinase
MLPSQTHKSVCQGCAHSFAADALFCPNCGTARARDVSNDPLLGATVGDRYSLKELIGMGASGTIYRAEHVTLRRRVAVKVLHHELSRDDLAIERFRRQATTVGEIENDHIVEVHDFGRAPDGRLYIAMEYLEGETLDERLERGPLSIKEAVDILIQLGEALIESHAIGYVHRDLRPRNLFLAVRRGEANFLKLLDFGLSKLVASEGEAASTSLGMTFGDPHYMSPEQARGEPIDRRADIYSMGCIAFQMLTGEPPFSGGRVFDVLARHVEEPARAPSTLRPETEDVPEWLDATVLRCLEKRPSRRFITVFRLVEALREGLRSGAAMDDARARRRETELPPTVSRVMKRLGDRLDADGRMDDADDTRFGTDTDITDLTEAPNFDGRRTELGLGAAGSRTAVKSAGRIATPVTDDLTEPSAPPPEAIAAELSDGVPAAAVPSEPTPPPRRPTRGKIKVPALTPPERAPLSDGDEDPEDLRVTRAVARKSEARPAERPARPEPEPEAEPSASASASASFDDSDEYDYYEDEYTDEIASGKSWRSTDSSAGISGAWLDEGDALGDSGADLEAAEAEKLREARAARGLGKSGSLLPTDEIYFDAGEGRLKWVIVAVGAIAVVIALLLIFAGGDGEPETSASGIAADAAVASTTPEVEPTQPVDAAAVIPDAAPTEVADKPEVKPEVKPDRPAVKPDKPDKPDRPAVKPDKPDRPAVTDRDPPDNSIDLGLEPDKPDKPGGKPTDDDKRRADFFAQIGRKHLAGGNVPGAAVEFRKALKLNPSNGQAVTGLGQIALRQGSYAAAVKHLKRASRLRSGSSSVHTLLGEAYLGSGNRGAAAESFKQALRLDPDSQRARRGLSEAGGG